MGKAGRFGGPLRRGLAPALAGILAAAGCGIVPRTQLDECHKLSRTLQAETARLKDANLALAAQNRDYAGRSVDDARRISSLEDQNRLYRQSILGYQQERDRMVAAYDRLKADLQTPAAPRQASRQ